MSQPEPVVTRHADHDPSLICRPALGYGLCEVLEGFSDEGQAAPVTENATKRTAELFANAADKNWLGI